MKAAVIRSAGPDDLIACTDVWRSTVDDTLPPATETYGLHGHELATGTLLVAEAAGEVIGFGASITRGSRWFLADLFVSPDAHGGGLGRRIIDQLVAVDQPGPMRATMASSDLRALTLYSKLGMAPRWPCLVMRSGPTGVDLERLAGTPHGVTPQVEVVDAPALLELAALSGYALDRADLDYWIREVDADLMVVRNATGRAMGGAVVRWSTPFSITDPTTISIGPLFAGTTTDLAPVVAHVVGAAEARSGGRALKLYVPGPNPMLAPLLDAGFSIVDLDLFSASHDDVIDPLRTFPSHDLL